MSDHPLRKVRTAWLVVAGSAAIWILLMLIAPNQPMKSADTWSFVGVFWLGLLMMLPMVGVAVLVTAFSLASVIRVGPAPLLKWLGWTTAGVVGLGMSVVMIAGISKSIWG